MSCRRTKKVSHAHFKGFFLVQQQVDIKTYGSNFNLTMSLFSINSLYTQTIVQ